ncbi:MAG TPA: hypothetical protein VGB90_05160 [Alphaproteobacteria bacterium]
MADSLERFCADAREILKGGADDAARAKVAKRLESLLVEPEFVAKYFDPKVEAAQQVVYRDPATGFNVLVHHQKPSQRGAPHDHGESWAIYGVTRNYTDMTEWRRLDDAAKPGVARIEQARTYRLGVGQAAAYGPRVIHNTCHPDGAWVVRVTGCDLDEIPRRRYVPEKGEVKEFGRVPA